MTFVLTCTEADNVLLVNITTQSLQYSRQSIPFLDLETYSDHDRCRLD